MPLVHETVRAELNARRRGTASTHDPRQGLGRRRQAVAPEGHRPRPRRLLALAAWTGGGIVFGPTPRHYTFKVNRKARRAALRSALSVHAERESLAVFDAGAVRRAVDRRRPPSCSTDWGADGPTLVLLAPRRPPPASRFATSRAST